MEFGAGGKVAAQKPQVQEIAHKQCADTDQNMPPRLDRIVSDVKIVEASSDVPQVQTGENYVAAQSAEADRLMLEEMREPEAIGQQSTVGTVDLQVPMPDDPGHEAPSTGTRARAKRRVVPTGRPAGKGSAPTNPRKNSRVKLARKATTGPRYRVGDRCRIVSNGMWSYHDITVNRPDLKGRECVVWKEPVYPDTWFVVRLDGDEDVTVKARASNLKVIRSQCGGSPPDDSPSAASPSPALNHREDDVGPATQPESSAGNDRNTGTPEEALGRWLCADVFESFVYSNSLDPDGSETHKLLQVARAEIMPGLYRVLHGTPMTHESDESGSDWDQDYSILSPTAVMSLWRHLDAGKYQTFKAWVGDVRRLFAYAYQLPLSEADSWRIQVAESWFDSALICAGQLSQCKPPPVPKTTPSDWPGSSTQLQPTLSLTAADRSIDIVKIVAALLRECGGAATPAMVPQTVTAPSPPG